jgi:hypothetical protein
MTAPDDDEPLHPWVREQIEQGNRDKPLTLNWLPAEPQILDALGLPALTPMATAARTQILTEALVAGADRWTSYSRRWESYAHGQRYFRATYTYRAIIPAVDQLASLGLLDHEKMPQGHRGFQSRFRASDVLLKELGKLPVIYQPVEWLILRDLHGDLVDYSDSRETRRMRKHLRTINEALLSQEIGIKGRIIREGDPLENGARARVQMHRVFNRSSFNLGGRFYGSYWQNIPKAERKLITLGGKETVEHDYAALHIRLLYQEAGKPLVGDPYDLADWPRNQVKLAMLISINAPTEIAAVRAIALYVFGSLYRADQAKARALLRAVKAKHADIAHAFGSDAGARLMRKDSDIAEQVMLDMIRQGVVPLSIHDSYIVPADQGGKLEESMEREMRRNDPCGSATSQVTDLPQETPEMLPQYGTEESECVGRGRGGVAGCSELVVRCLSAHPICYPFMEVRRAHNSLYPSKPHIISDNVAHTRESEGDTSAL